MRVRRALLAVLVAAALAPAAAHAQTFSEFGAGTMNGPLGVAVDQNGFVYVADSGNSVIRKFTNVGGSVATFGPALGGGTALQEPTGVAVDLPANQADAPHVYVADQTSNKVQKLSSSGAFLLDFGTFEDPTGVDVDATGHVWVTDAGPNNDILVKFAPDGTLLNVYGTPGGGPGSAPGRFDDPRDIDIDTDGDTVVADGGNDRLQKLDPLGNQLWQTGSLADPTGVDNDIDLTGSDTLVDRVWATENGADRFTELDDTGAVLQTIGGSGTGLGQFDRPYGLATDCADNVFVSDFGNDRVQRFGTASQPPCSIPVNVTSPATAGEARPGSGLALDPGTWSGSPTPRLSYRWQRCRTDRASSCGDVAGQRGLTYVVSDADRGFRLRAVVVAANNQGVVSQPTDMTAPVPVRPVRPLPPVPPNPPPVPPVPPNPPVKPPKVKRTGIASFKVGCPVTGRVACRVKADVIGPAESKRAHSRAERPGYTVLARVRGTVRFDTTKSFRLRLSRRAKRLVRGGYDERAVLRISVDGKRQMTGKVRLNRRTATEFGR
jgi:streptogramin lyase